MTRDTPSAPQHPNPRLGRTVGIACLLLAAGCEDAAAGLPSVGDAPELSSARATTAPRLNDRRQKTHDTTGAERLGTRPDGVGIAVGKPAPDAEIRDAEGKVVRLSSLWSKGAVMLVFYRGGWCPYCNFQIRKLTKAHGDFVKAGVLPVAISVDTANETAKTESTYEIPFPMLSDSTLVAHEAYRVVQTVSEARIAELREKGMDLESASGQNHHKIAIPAVFLVDQRGVVRWVHADPSYKVRPSPEQLLTVVADTKLTL